MLHNCSWTMDFSAEPPETKKHVTMTPHVFHTCLVANALINHTFHLKLSPVEACVVP